MFNNQDTTSGIKEKNSIGKSLPVYHFIPCYLHAIHLILLVHRDHFLNMLPDYNGVNNQHST